MMSLPMLGSLLDTRLIVLQVVLRPIVIVVSKYGLVIVLHAVWQEMLGHLDQTMRLLLRVYFVWCAES